MGQNGHVGIGARGHQGVLVKFTSHFSTSPGLSVADLHIITAHVLRLILIGIVQMVTICFARCFSSWVAFRLGVCCRPKLVTLAHFLTVF